MSISRGLVTAAFRRLLLAVALAAGCLSGARGADSESPGRFPRDGEAAAKSPLSHYLIGAQRIVWKTAEGVSDETMLLEKPGSQALLRSLRPALRLAPGAGVVIDFGRQLTGHVELITPMTKDKNPARARIRFGESVAEAMAQLGERGAQNDHALRDFTLTLPWLGKTQTGASGFRFVRIDALDSPVELSSVYAVLHIRDIPYLGSFRSSDPRLDEIWRTGAWTVHLNMQDFLWDGVKRDRLVWLGDMHPEVAVINAVFGPNPVVPASLDLIRDVTPVTAWMNGISSYSMWWIIIHEDWYTHHGDLDYLRAQQTYLTGLLRRLTGFVDAEGREQLDGMRFIDWPTFENPAAVHEGLQGMFARTMRSGARLMRILGDETTAKLCEDTTHRLARHQPPASGRKSPAALLALAGLRAAGDVLPVLKKDGPADLSTFYGYYVLEALSAGGDHATALAYIRTYWGAMLDFGATSFWEDFDLAWTKNAARIDELVPAGKQDLHGDFGAHCYVGFRHSLCHGWAAGPTAWLSRHVLGITPAEPGFRRVRINPQLGDLAWAEGAYPTPHGVIKVRHERGRDGKIHSEISLPEGVVLEKTPAPTAEP
jgi:hypothetical protein